MALDLAELVTAAKAGDKAAFDELVEATHAEMYTLAYRLTGNAEDAQDVVQEAYLRAYKGLKRFRGDAEFTTLDVPDHGQLRHHASGQAGARHRHDEHPTRPRTHRRAARGRPEAQARRRPTTAPGSTDALQSLPPETAGRGRPPRRLRPAPRGHRRRARDHARGRPRSASTGPAASCGSGCSRCRGEESRARRTPVQCDQVARPAFPRSSTAARAGRTGGARATWTPACAARPSWCSTASCCKALRTLRTDVLEPAPGTLTAILASLEAAGERGAMRSLLTGRRAAYVGGIAAATAAAGAAGAIVLANRARTGARCASPASAWRRTAAAAGDARRVAGARRRRHRC